MFLNPLEKYVKFHFLWEWEDFGVMFRVFKNTGIGDYVFSIDIQVAWLNIWITCLKKS